LQEDVMAEATHFVEIAKPIETVFAFIDDGEKCPQWRPGILDIKRVSGEGVGATYTQGVSGPMGRRVSADYQVTMFEPNRRIEFQTTAGPVRPHGRYDFEAVAGGTRLTFSLDAEVKGLKKLLMGSMVQKTMVGEVQALDNLKRILEG
jgi:carbon monoxide dehydrogenase subunit G